jgi:hypothetical protein
MALFDAAGFQPAFVLPDALAVVQPVGTLRWATAAYISGPADAPANTLWEPRLLGDVEIGQVAVDAVGIGGLLPVGLADIALADADAALADLDRWSTADGRRATITVIPVEDPRASDFGTPLAGRTVGFRFNLLAGTFTIARTDPIAAFTGITARVDRNGDRTGTLRLVDVVERLAVPLQPTKYQGTGGVEGGEELEDKPKPVALGRCYNLEPVPLGDIDLGAGALPTFQYHWREAQAADEIRIRGVVQTLVGGTPVIGQARDFPTLGLFQLGSTPDGTVRCDVRGDAVGGYVSSTSGVIKRLVQSLGPQLGAGDIDATAFAFAENDLPGEIGWCQGPSEITAAQACQRIVAGPGAILCGGRRGVLRLVDPLAEDIDQFTLEEHDILECVPLPMPAGLKPLPRAAGVGWGPNWAPVDDIAGSVAAAVRTRLGKVESGPARAQSPKVTGFVAQQRDLVFSGLYWSRVDAQARATKWRDFLAAGPRLFRVVTDRYLHEIEMGHIGRIAYPAWGLDSGARVSVVGWAEQVAARRLALTVVTLPEA